MFLRLLFTNDLSLLDLDYLMLHDSLHSSNDFALQ